MAFSGNISYGATGENVKKIQEKLNATGNYNLTVDGIWGAKTDAAVKAYQNANGLAADGIVGKNTWASLFGNSTSEASSTSSNFTYDEFSHPTYEESDEVISARNEKNTADKAVTDYGDFSWQRQSDYDKLLNDYKNREDFSYDINADALYQQYKDKYIQQGKMASQDVMGQAASATGGYGNSYAASVGNQAYQSSLQNLNDIVPELYQLAYDRYNQKGQDMLNQISLMGNERDIAYGQWVDKYNMAAADRDYYNAAYSNAQNSDYSKYIDNRDYAYSQYADDKAYAYQNYRDSIADAQWQAQFDEAKRQYDQSYALSQKSSSSGSSKTTSSNYSGKKTEETSKPTTTATPTLKNRDEAVSYLASKGVTSKYSSSIMTVTEWNRRKNSYKATGQGGAEVANYSSYEDYLADITEYMMEKYT